MLLYDSLVGCMVKCLLGGIAAWAGCCWGGGGGGGGGAGASPSILTPRTT